MKCEYDPQFLYSNPNQTSHFQVPHKKHVDVALNILLSCIKEYGSEENYSEVEGGRLLTKEETEEYFNRYIEQMGVKDLITFEFANHTVAPTSVIHSNVDNSSRVIIFMLIIGNYRATNNVPKE